MNKYYSVNREDSKWEEADEKYFSYIQELEQMQISNKEIIYNFPVFVGQVNIARNLFFYELYKIVINLAGDIAEIGTYKGASFLWWAKLVKLFEPYNATQVYGFDWFKGMETSEDDDKSNYGKYKASYEYLVKLIEMQDLQNIALLCKMDVVEEAINFMNERPWLRFKLLFIDCGIKEVMEKSFEAFYPRLVKGGILVMDHYNLKISPTESDIVDKYIGKNKVLQMPFNRHSTGYIIKD